MNDIVLIGQGPTAITAAESLGARHKVSAIIRSVVGPHDPVAVFAAKHSIPILDNVTEAGIRAALLELHPACVVISSYNRLIRHDVLELNPCINVHYGPLPRYRGRANVNWTIINKEREAAITIHCVDPGLDSGNILFQESIELQPDSSITEVYERLNEIQRRELGEVVERFLTGHHGTAQEGPGTYCCTRVPGDGEINWSAPTEDIYALIRALAKPYDGAFTFVHLRRIKIVQAVPLLEAPWYVGRIPGRVCNVNRESGAVDVLTGDGILRIYEIEDQEGVCRPAASVIRSTKDSLGLVPRDLLMYIEQLQERVDSLVRTSSSETISGGTGPVAKVNLGDLRKS